MSFLLNPHRFGAAGGGDPGGGSAHRYWRIEFTDNDETTISSYLLSEMQVLASYAGGNLMRLTNTTTNVTADTTPDQPFSNIFNALYGAADSPRRTWAPGTWPTTNPQVDIDLGDGNEVAINIVRIGTGSSPAFTHVHVRAIAVFHSDDGVTYTEAWTRSLAGSLDVYQIYDFVRPGYSESYSGSPHPAYRHYRMLYFDVETQLFGIAAVEIEFRTASGGADIATGGTASASKTSTGSHVSGAAAAFDDDTGTFHYMANPILNQRVAYDLGAGNEAKVGEAAFRCRTDAGSSEQNQSPRRHAIQGSADGTTWDTLWCGNFGAPSSGALMESTDPLYV